MHISCEQIDFGEYHAEKARGSGGNVRDLQVLQALDKFYPYRYRDGLAADTLKYVSKNVVCLKSTTHVFSIFFSEA